MLLWNYQYGRLFRILIVVLEICGDTRYCLKKWDLISPLATTTKGILSESQAPGSKWVHQRDINYLGESQAPGVGECIGGLPELIWSFNSLHTICKASFLDTEFSRYDISLKNYHK